MRAKSDSNATKEFPGDVNNKLKDILRESGVIFNTFDLSHPNTNRFEQLLQTYNNKLAEMQNKPNITPADKTAIQKAEEKFKDWWSVELKARKFKSKNNEKADQAYKDGIKQFPNSAPLLGNYANFLADIRKDHDNAEAFYIRALVADPDHTNNLSNYAIFLKNIRKDHDNAETFYKRALVADPDNANNLGNYGGLLCGLGKISQGLELIEKSLNLADDQTPKDTILECHYYKYAHTKDETTRNQSLKQIVKLIQSGVRSAETWDFTPNINRAKQDNHPDPALLQALADIITNKSDPKTLQKFPQCK